MVDATFDLHPEMRQWAAEMQPNKRLGQPGEVAEAALWLLSEAASLITGISLPVDGGHSMVGSRVPSAIVISFSRGTSCETPPMMIDACMSSSMRCLR